MQQKSRARRQVESLTRLHGAKLEEDTPKPVKPAPEEEPENLDDERVQSKILHPEEVTIELQGPGEVRLHKPSVLMGRRIFGFVTRVLTDAATIETAQGALPMRVASLLTENEGYERKLCELAVRLYGKPGQISDNRVEALADELQETATQDDIVMLFAQLSLIAGIGKQDAKNPITRRRK